MTFLSKPSNDREHGAGLDGSLMPVRATLFDYARGKRRQMQVTVPPVLDKLRSELQHSHNHLSFQAAAAIPCFITTPFKTMATHHSGLLLATTNNIAHIISDIHTKSCTRNVQGNEMGEHSHDSTMTRLQPRLSWLSDISPHSHMSTLMQSPQQATCNGALPAHSMLLYPALGETGHSLTRSSTSANLGGVAGLTYRKPQHLQQGLEADYKHKPQDQLDAFLGEYAEVKRLSTDKHIKKNTQLAASLVGPDEHPVQIDKALGRWAMA